MEKKRKKLELRISFESDSEFDVIFDYFRRHGKKPRSVVLEAIRILWEPYIRADVDGLSGPDVERLIDVSYQRYMSHYQLMCVELGLRKPGGFEGESQGSPRNGGSGLSSRRSRPYDEGSRSSSGVSFKSGLGDDGELSGDDVESSGGDGEFTVDDLPDFDVDSSGGFDFD
ncbi:MAG: hypothetical protein F6K24_01525 [Okeania sp. SIO2D1]|nr:hypothetical protein [Okeania sp. SIO2D1]